MNNETKGRAIVDFEKIILNVHEAAWNEGEKKGRKNQADEFEQSMDIEFEKHATEYTVKQFTDCHTLADFQEKLKEITSRSYNFM